MEWTPEAVKAEVDYRHAALRADAARTRVDRRPASSRRRWWAVLGHRSGPESPGAGNERPTAA
ncbi:hypothetical protein [Saccharothrix sp. Mg75]|uniref:hypothetical protein n=1 Tax=Saccharothrix sp. Mg75 TaxID=3445357 RepID=UPI003EE9CBDE